MSISNNFDQFGYLAPFPLLERAECRQLMRHIKSSHFKPPMDWYKGLAISDPIIRELALDERICSVVRQCLGKSIDLWGANLVTRKPGQPHPWHSDIESSSPRGGFASVWIGLENVSSRTSFSLIAGSHLTGRTVQETRHAHNISREVTTSSDALRWACGYNRDCRLIGVEMQTGSALLFDGRIWHCTANSGFMGKRWALLLQYARRGADYRVFDSDKLDWPISWKQDYTPQLIEVDGG